MHEESWCIHCGCLETYKAFKCEASCFWYSTICRRPKNLKLLKATPTRWLSHGEVSKHVASCMESLINALDTIIKNKSESEINRIQDQLLEPNNMHFLLLLTFSIAMSWCISTGSQSIFRIKILFLLRLDANLFNWEKLCLQWKMQKNPASKRMPCNCFGCHVTEWNWHASCKIMIR